MITIGPESAPGAPNRAYRIVGDFVCVMAVLAAGYSTSCRQNSSEVEHGADSAEEHARRASVGDSGRLGSEIGGGEGTAEESPPAVRLTDKRITGLPTTHPRRRLLPEM